MKVKVTRQGQISNGKFSCPHYNFKTFLRFPHENLYKYKVWTERVQRNRGVTLHWGLT